MTTPSHAQQPNLSIAVYQANTATVGSYDPRGTYLFDVRDQIDGYGHTINAVGGYWESSFTIKDRLGKLEDWIMAGLGRHVEVYNPALERIWGGFVNQITLDVGPFSITHGPLIEIANFVTVSYCPLNTAVNPPIVGARAVTIAAQDAASQQRYGLIEKVLAAGTTTVADAIQIGATYLEEHKEPETSKSVSLGRAQEPQIVVHCLGYVHFLMLYVYNQVALSGFQSVTNKLGDILDNDPNGLFSAAAANLTANPFLVAQYENDDMKAWSLIKSLVALGDVNSLRYLFGVYDDHVPTYATIPTDVEYYQRLSDPAQRIENIAGGEIKPWDVKAGKWLMFPDFLVGHAPPANLRDDPRAVFIESVKYIAPWSLELSGSKVGTLAQRLAQLALGGLGT